MAAEITEQRVAATVEVVQEVVACVAAQAQRCGFGAELLTRLELAVEEAAVNVCHYAYPDASGEMVIRTSCLDGELQIELEDRGTPFDPLAAPSPDLEVPLEQRRIGGLGIHLIRKVCDGVSYRRDGDRNILTLVLRGRS